MSSPEDKRLKRCGVIDVLHARNHRRFDTEEPWTTFPHVGEYLNIQSFSWPRAWLINNDKRRKNKSPDLEMRNSVDGGPLHGGDITPCARASALRRLYDTIIQYVYRAAYTRARNACMSLRRLNDK